MNLVYCKRKRDNRQVPKHARVSGHKMKKMIKEHKKIKLK